MNKWGEIDLAITTIIIPGLLLDPAKNIRLNEDMIRCYNSESHNLDGNGDILAASFKKNTIC